MKTRYWKELTSINPVMWRVDGDKVDFRDNESSTWEMSACTADSFECDPTVIECTADGTPLSEIGNPPDSTLTLDEIRAFFKRIETNYAALLEKEGGR